MSIMLFYSQSAAPPFELNGKHFKSKMLTNVRKRTFSVFPILISQLQLEPVSPLYFQRHYAVPTVVYESPPGLKQRISAGFHCQQKDETWWGSGAVIKISSTTMSAWP